MYPPTRSKNSLLISAAIPASAWANPDIISIAAAKTVTPVANVLCRAF